MTLSAPVKLLNTTMAAMNEYRVPVAAIAMSNHRLAKETEKEIALRLTWSMSVKLASCKVLGAEVEVDFELPSTSQEGGVLLFALIL